MNPFGRRSDAADAATERWVESVVVEAYPADEERISRVRERILLQARVATREAAALRETPPRRPFIGPRAGTGRRAGLLAFGLLLASVGAVAGAESGPGEAFYGARLAVEDLTLPPETTPEGVDARLDSLRRRLGEAAVATAAGDERAAGAALAAYHARLARLFHSDDAGVDLSDVAVDGVELPDVAARLQEDDDLVRSLEKALGHDDSTATGVIGEMTRIRSAIADQVARDVEAREHAGSGDGLGPRSSPSANDKSKSKSKAPVKPTKKKRVVRPAASPTTAP